MTAEEILALRTRLGWSRERMAVRIGTALATIYRWEKGKTKPQGIYVRALQELARKGK